MSHRFSLPTDAEMEGLISQVYGSMLVPEQSRLSLIESKLLQETRKNKSKKNLNKIPWWIVLILAGGFASAAWWAGDMYFDKNELEIVDLKINNKIIERQLNLNNIDSNVEDNSQNNESYEDRGSPVIYQRENF